jgi:hypothetical protein
MLSLPATFISVMAVFAPVFSKPVWHHVKVLLTGTVLAPRKRTVTSALCVMGLSAAAHVHSSHRVLNRAVWSPLGASRLLLRLLIAVFVPAGVVVCDLDETLERRRGPQINTKGIYLDPVRSSRAHFVNVSVLRWRCCMLLTPMRWAHRVWALPLITVLGPYAHFYEPQDRRAQTLVQRAWQIIHVVVCWLPGRVVLFVADSSDAALAWLHQVRTWRCASLIKRARRPTLEATWADEERPWHQLTMT